jgi:hypothetical protein
MARDENQRSRRARQTVASADAAQVDASSDRTSHDLGSRESVALPGEAAVAAERAVLTQNPAREHSANGRRPYLGGRLTRSNSQRTPCRTAAAAHYEASGRTRSRRSSWTPGGRSSTARGVVFLARERVPDPRHPASWLTPSQLARRNGQEWTSPARWSRVLAI